MKNKKILVAALLVMTMALFLSSCDQFFGHKCESICEECGKCLDAECAEATCQDKCPGHAAVSGDTEAPVITVTGVPATCIIGEEITVPAATALDAVDGDVSARIKLTVSVLKENGEVSRDLIYQKAGNVAQTFKASSATLFTYKIVYEVKDAAGNKAKAEFTLVADQDNEAGSLVINEASVDGFVLANGLLGKAGEYVTLPSAIAIDQPYGNDISASIQARLYEKNSNGDVSATAFISWTDFSEAKSVLIPAGTYQIVYTVKDAAGNKFPDEIKFDVVISAPEGNLLDDKNFTMDWDSEKGEYREGMSWVNEAGNICLGQTSALPNINQMVGVTFNGSKIFDQYVAFTFNADPSGDDGEARGQMFYTIAARGSKDASTLPNRETCTWPPYLSVRMSSRGFEPKASQTPDNDMTVEKAFTGNLLDGKDHTLYIQWRSTGDSATAEDAAIYVLIWVDTLPTADKSGATFIAYVKAADYVNESTNGVILTEEFVSLWNETGAGWFSIGAYSNGQPNADDHMRLKGFAIYDKDETDFAVDLKAPVITLGSQIGVNNLIHVEITLPAASSDDGSEVKCYVVDPQGYKEEVTTGKYTPSKLGTYTVIYESVDAAGNLAVHTVSFNSVEPDNEAPVITLSNENSISTNVGQTVTLPTASVLDNVDGDISSGVVITSDREGVLSGTAWTPMTAGEHTITYSVKDAFGNKAEKSIKVLVAGISAGNCLPDPVLVQSGKTYTYTTEKIYDQKVSMIVNVADTSKVYQFNVRGPVKNANWPNGMVLRFTNSGIEISAAWHDHVIFGKYEWSTVEGAKEYYYQADTDMLVEFQVDNVVVDGVAYIKVSLWIDGEQRLLDKRTSKLPSAVNGIEADDKHAVYVPVADVVSYAPEAGTIENNIYAATLHVAASGGGITIKELRIDGTSCTWDAPDEGGEGGEGGETAGTDILNGTPVSAASGSPYKATETIYDNKVSAIVNVTDTSKVYQFNVRGAAGATGNWPSGMVLRLTNTGIEISAKGHDGAIFGKFEWKTTKTDGYYHYEANRDMLLEFQLEDVTIGGVDYIRVKLWVDGVQRTMVKRGSGVNGLEEGDAYCVYAEKAFVEETKANNTNASPFYVAVSGGSITIKELRVDGTSCKLPE